MRGVPFGVLASFILVAICTTAAASPPVSPRVDYVDPLPDQPQKGDPATILYDDFDQGNPIDRYYEYNDNNGDFIPADYEKFGSRGRAMRARFQKGEVGAGVLMTFFGDNPAVEAGKANLAPRRGERFNEVYWRFLLKHQRGWQGSPAKLSRATVIASPNWAQAAIAHHWAKGDYLTLDPASGIRLASNPGEKDTLVTTKYNDFPNLRWHGGNTPVGKFPIFSTAESAHWVTVECCFRLNTPGKSDGEFTAWIDGKEDCARRNLNWTGTWNAYGINALFLENYWNQGSLKEQERYFDNYVIATKPVGPMVVPLEPTIVKTAFEDPDPADKQSAWQVRIASDPEGKNVAWDSGTISSDGNSCVAKGLKPDAAYWTSLRQCDSGGEWSDWSPWHGWFRTAAQ